MKAQTIATNMMEKARAGPAPGPACQGVVVHQVIEQRSVQDGGGIKLLARDGGADYGENSRTDHRADAQRGQRPGAKRFLETVLGELRVADQLVDRFGCEQLLSQRLGSLSMPNFAE